MEIQNNAESDTLKQLREMRSGGLPSGAAPIVQEENETPAAEQEPAVEASAPNEAAPAEPVKPADEDEVIRIGDQEFKSAAEAIKYAERLENERLVSQAYNMGIKETLAATQPQEAPPVVEDNFEERFYADPKAALKEMKEQASKEALVMIKAEQQRENLWNSFLNEYPDIERRDAERILAENMDTLRRLTDVEKGKQLLATKVRAEYQRIADKFKPKVQLANTSGRIASSSSAPIGVTPKGQAEKPLTLAQQMKSLKKRS